MKTVNIYTDGACRGNPGLGGWGVIIEYENITKEYFGGEKNTTNNKMELKAAIEGLKILKEACKVNITTDSKYVMDGITSWINNWKKNNWKNASKKDVKNKDLWIELAKKYDTEVKVIKNINYLEGDLLSIDETLLIPLGKTKSNNFIPYEMYIVSEGDTLWSISKKYNIEIRDLAKMNSINENEYLQLGQQLSIGNKNIHRNIESKKRTILYSIKQGDNLYKISELFDVSIKSIEDINNFKQPTLMPGQIIKIAIRAF